MTSWWEALGLGLALVGAAGAASVVTLRGAFVGGALAALFAKFGGVPLLSAFALLVVLGAAVTRVGLAKKRGLGAEEASEGRRGARSALANAGPALGFLLLWPNAFGTVSALAALAASFSDTVAGEIGLLAKSPPRRLLLGRQVSPGEDGGMTWLGTGASLLAACLAGVLAARLSDFSGVGPAVLIGGLLGNLADSAIGAWIEPRLSRSLGNTVTNALASACGGGVGGSVYLLST